MQIAPSILSADFSRMGDQVREVCEAGARWLHLDVMDGHFVPNLTFGPPMIAALRPIANDYQAILDAHLMISNPDRYLEDYARAGADMISVHVEVCPHLHRTIHAIKALGKQAGVVLNPATSLTTIEEILPDLDLVLLMSVNPGFGGQKFIPSTLTKIERLCEQIKQRGLNNVTIQIDGGVNHETLVPLVKAGAQVLVIGSALFNTRASVATNYAALNALA